MVALAVLAITLTSIYRLHGQTLMMSATGRFYHQAPMLAAAKLAEIERAGINDTTDGSGDFGEDYSGYAWQVRIEQMPSEIVPDSTHLLSRIDIRITRDDELSYDLRTYRFHAR